MSWIDVRVIEDSLSETRARDGTVSAQGEKVYYVEADDVIDLDEALSASAGDPAETVAALGEAFSATRPRCVCRSRKPERLTPCSANVRCGFEDPTDGDTDENLVDKDARITERSESFTEEYAIDAEGSNVVNTAGEVFGKLPQRQAGIAAYVVRKYVSSTTKAAIAAAWNTNNSASVTIKGVAWAADELWLSDCSFDEIEGSTLFDATYTIKAKRGGWSDRVLNVGYRNVDGKDIKINSAGELDVISGDPVATPWPLDEDGWAKVPLGALLAADELVFYPYEQAAWTGVPVA